jgi:integrase
LRTVGGTCALLGAVAALVPLPRGLPSDTELRSDLWPADAEVDGAVDECVKICLRLVFRRSTALESLQHLCHRPIGSRLHRQGRIRLVLRPDDPRRPPGSLTPPAPWLRHAIKDAGCFERTRASTVDRRSVVNPRQARALLEAVRGQQPSGARLVAFFAVMHYARLRPEEAINLRADDVVLPAEAQQDAHDDNEWGELHPRSATPDAGSDWTDDGSHRERRQLKHRAERDSRIVPAHAEQTRILRNHLAEFGVAPDGRLFTGVRGGELPTITYRRAWTKARQAALTATEQASPLARRPYDLRHACLSTWLNGGVYPTQVAEWAGHSVDVLLRIYARCVVGQDELAKRRISEALRQS